MEFGKIYQYYKLPFGPEISLMGTDPVNVIAYVQNLYTYDYL